MVTPFDDSLNLNEAEARRIAAYLVDDQKNDGLVISGTTGESPTLTETEKLRLLEIVLDEVGDRAAVILGAGSYNTMESIHMAKEGERRGAHGIMLVNPYYNKPGQDGLYAHFSTIANAIKSPVMLYNIQPRSSINLETPTLMRLIKDVPNIAAVKEASGNIAQISEVIREAPSGFRTYSGDDAIMLPMLALGAFGLVSVAAHIKGAEFKEMIEVFETNPARARELHHQLEPVVKAVFAAPSPAPIKHAMVMRGFDCSKTRLPIVPLSDDQKKQLEPVLKP